MSTIRLVQPPGHYIFSVRSGIRTHAHIRDDIRLWVKSCIECQANKKPRKSPRAPLGSMAVGAPLDRMATDFMGPFPITPRGNRYILVVSDQFSKWVEIFSLPDQSATKCASTILNEVISRFGTPLSIHSDQGRNYESQIFQQLCRLLEIKKTRTSIRNPKGNGHVERFNRTLLSLIKNVSERRARKLGSPSRLPCWCLSGHASRIHRPDSQFTDAWARSAVSGRSCTQ